VQVDLDSDPHAPAEARQATRDVLARWRLPALIDTVVLAVSELVTNAIRHGRPPVGLTLRRREQDLRVDVHDADPREPPRGQATSVAEAESGRGMDIVAALAGEVGVEQIPDDGKVVFASFPTDEAATAPMTSDGSIAP
jgi:anti-sigma regulatory factor (Ser/Thr protein kinase)